jgi:hypothetical protein
VFLHWNRGEILEARDVSLGANYVAKEVELVLKLGLLCSHSEPAARPSMRQIVQFLEGEFSVPELSSLSLCVSGLTFANNKEGGFSDFAMSYPSLRDRFTQSSFTAESLLSVGR